MMRMSFPVVGSLERMAELRLRISHTRKFHHVCAKNTTPQQRKCPVTGTFAPPYTSIRVEGNAFAKQNGGVEPAAGPPTQADDSLILTPFCRVSSEVSAYVSNWPTTFRCQLIFRRRSMERTLRDGPSKRSPRCLEHPDSPQLRRAAIIARTPFE